MSEGTKLGEFKENEEAVFVEVAAAPSQETLSATKMGGDVSEFEKEVLAESGSSDKSSVKEQSDESFGDIFEEAMATQLLEFSEGDVVTGTVRNIEKGGILIDFNYKSDGYVMNPETTSEQNGSNLNPGDEILVVIEKLETKEGYSMLSIRKAASEQAWNDISDYAKDKKTVTVKVSSKVQGGLVASFMDIKGFIPASQVIKTGIDDLEHFVGKDLEVAVIQADRRRKKVIFSHKVAQMKLQKESAIKMLADIEVGEVKEGTVTSIKDFGVFVDIGGIEGLVHISELSWSRVQHPSEHVSAGDTVKVFVLGVDKENGRISLGMKQLDEDPWVRVAKNYEVGQVVTGTITRVVPFGAFIKIEDNLEGLIHISELANKHVDNVNEVVNSGDKVEAKIIKLVPEEQRIGLSIKRINEEIVEEKPAPIVEDYEEDNVVFKSYGEDDDLNQVYEAPKNVAEVVPVEEKEDGGVQATK